MKAGQPSFRGFVLPYVLGRWARLLESQLDLPQLETPVERPRGSRREIPEGQTNGDSLREVLIQKRDESNLYISARDDLEIDGGEGRE